jgi:hypothetical protein
MAKKDKRLKVHHKIFLCRNGKNTPDNQSSCLKTCRKQIHVGSIVPKTPLYFKARYLN